jgi:SH3-like domain-containing protein
MWVDSSGQVHRSQKNNANQNTRNTYTRRYSTSSTSSGKAVRRLVTIACVIGVLILLFHQCNARPSNNRTQPVIPRQYFGTVIPPALNVREGPSTSYYIRDKIYQYERVEIVEKYNNSWVKISYKNGRTGYVNGEYLSE